MKQEQVFRIVMIVMGVALLVILLQQQLSAKPLIMKPMNPGQSVKEFATNLDSDVMEDKNSPSVVGMDMEMPRPDGELLPEDLLPDHTADVEFAREHPLTQGNLVNRNYLDAGFIAGVPRQPLKNTNLSIRAEPPVERVQLSPWNQVSNKPDVGSERIGFELGGCS